MKKLGTGLSSLVLASSLLGYRAANAQPGAAVPMPMPAPTPSADATLPAPVAPVAVAPPAVPASPPVINAPSMIPVRSGHAEPRPAYDDGEKGPRSPSTATGYALLGTLAGPALTALAIAASNDDNDDLAAGLGWLAAAGYLAGPAAGRWYAGESGAGTILVRTGGAGLLIAGLASSICLDSCEEQGSGPGIAMLSGAGLFIGATIYDIATAGDAARDYNRAHRKSQSLTLLPLVKQSEGHTTTGLALSGSF